MTDVVRKIAGGDPRRAPQSGETQLKSRFRASRSLEACESHDDSSCASGLLVAFFLVDGGLIGGLGRPQTLRRFEHGLVVLLLFFRLLAGDLGVLLRDLGVALRALGVQLVLASLLFGRLLVRPG